MRTGTKKRRGGSPTKQFQDTGMSSEPRQVRQPAQEYVEPTALSFDDQPATQEQAQAHQTAVKADEETVAGSHLQTAANLQSRPVFQQG